MSDTYTDDKLIQRCLHDRIISQDGEIDGIDFLLHTLQPGLKILDVGCGPGTIAFQVSPHLRPAGYLVGVDISDETLQRATSSAKSQRITNLEFIQGTAYHLPFREAHFDVIYCRHLLMHLGDVTKTLHELIRVAQYGGHIIAFEGDIETWNYYPIFPAWERIFDIVRQRLGSGAVGRQLWTIFNELGLLNVQINGIAKIATGTEFKNKILKWVDALELSRNYIIKTNICSEDILENGLSEGYELLRHPFGFFSCIEYEISGRKI